MSESGKTKKLKLNPPAVSQGGTPQGSRAGSPTPLAGRSFSGSRASSPESFRGKSNSSCLGIFFWLCSIVLIGPYVKGKLAFPLQYALEIKASLRLRRFMLLFPPQAYSVVTCSKYSVPVLVSQRRTTESL